MLFALLVWLASGLTAKLASLAAEGNFVERLLSGTGRWIGLALLLYALVHVVLGFGLMAMQNWARLLTIVFAAVGIVSLLPRLIHPSPLALIMGIVNGFALVYLLAPPVRKMFQG